MLECPSSAATVTRSTFASRSSRVAVETKFRRVPQHMRRHLLEFCRLRQRCDAATWRPGQQHPPRAQASALPEEQRRAVLLTLPRADDDPVVSMELHARTLAFV